MTKLKLLTICIAFSLTGCVSLDKDTKNQNKPLGERSIKYYADKSVSSLEVPPDLTKPSLQNSLNLDDYAQGLEQNVVDFSNDSGNGVIKQSGALKNSTNIEVKKHANQRWLLVDKNPAEVWNLTKSFLKLNGFTIKNSNKKIGLMETNFLENNVEVPSQSLGVIKSFLQKALRSRYSLPVVDKYRVRIEPTDKANQVEVFLSLTSMEEVVVGDSKKSKKTMWQSKVKDTNLETEMLYRLMVFLGSDNNTAKKKIIATQAKHKSAVEVANSIGGYNKLIFPLNRKQTWQNIGWALDEIGVDIEDKDANEGAFYISTEKPKEKGFLAKLLETDAIKKSFQILIKQVASNKTEVYFNDLSEENNPDTIKFANDFLAAIASKF